ncbi:MAG: hypothetical protein K5897_00865 [Eubacterium sp.]|nr:hypothetical protein [Eubacterium sp.]
MNKKIIEDAMERVDDTFINEAIESIEKKKGAGTGNKGKWIALAVSAAAVIALGLILFFIRPTETDTNTEKGTGTLPVQDSTGVHIPAIEIEVPSDGVAYDMVALVVYHGKIYTGYEFIEDDKEKVLSLVGDYIGEATGSIDEWSTQSDYSKELAGSVAGPIYTVRGYDPDFRLCNVISYTDEQGNPGKAVSFLENLNGITLDKGADLFEERLQIKGHVKKLFFKSHEAWNTGSKEMTVPDMTANQELWDTFLDELDRGSFVEIDYVKDPGFYDNPHQVHLFVKKDDGTTVELRLFEGGYVGYQPLGWYFVKMPGEAFDAMYAACGG